MSIRVIKLWGGGATRNPGAAPAQKPAAAQEDEVVWPGGCPGWSVGRLVGWLVGWLIKLWGGGAARNPGWSVGRLVGWLVGWLNKAVGAHRS